MADVIYFATITTILVVWAGINEIRAARKEKNL